MKQFDINTTYFNATLNEDIFVHQSKGFIKQKVDTIVYKHSKVFTTYNSLENNGI
jgi:hypothetical protein